MKRIIFGLVILSLLLFSGCAGETDEAEGSVEAVVPVMYAPSPAVEGQDVAEPVEYPRFDVIPEPPVFAGLGEEIVAEPVEIPEFAMVSEPLVFASLGEEIVPDPEPLAEEPVVDEEPPVEEEPPVVDPDPEPKPDPDPVIVPDPEPVKPNDYTLGRDDDPDDGHPVCVNDGATTGSEDKDDDPDDGKPKCTNPDQADEPRNPPPLVAGGGDEEPDKPSGPTCVNP